MAPTVATGPLADGSISNLACSIPNYLCTNFGAFIKKCTIDQLIHSTATIRGFVSDFFSNKNFVSGFVSNKNFVGGFVSGFVSDFVSDFDSGFVSSRAFLTLTVCV